MIQVTRRYHFCASHRLHSEALSEAENKEVFGKCNHPYGHGHNYVLEVCVRGPVNAASGGAVSLPQLDALVQREVLDAIDHRNLNKDVPSFATTVPTTENLGLEIRRLLLAHWGETFPGEWPRLQKIGIQETPRNIFEVAAGEK